jgi:DNA-binding transcriptional ArsR family regulator
MARAYSYILLQTYSFTRIFCLRHIQSIMIETLRALAEPNRLQIVELLRTGPRPVGEMVRRLRLRQPQVSKHLRVLTDAGLVGVRVDAQRRIYALRAGPLQQLEKWLETYRQHWESNFQGLDSLLEELQGVAAQNNPIKRNARKRAGSHAKSFRR